MAQQRIGEPHARILLPCGDDERRVGLERAVQRPDRIAEPGGDMEVRQPRCGPWPAHRTRRADRDALVQGHDVFDLRIGNETIQQRRLVVPGLPKI